MNILRKTVHQSINMSPHPAENHSLQRWIRKEPKTKLLSLSIFFWKCPQRIWFELTLTKWVPHAKVERINQNWCNIPRLIELKPNSHSFQKEQLKSTEYQSVHGKRCTPTTNSVRVHSWRFSWEDSKGIAYSNVTCLNSFWCGATNKTEQLKNKANQGGNVVKI